MSPKRIQLSRKKGWRKPEGCIVVSRPSKWGNPRMASTYEQYGVPGLLHVVAALAVDDFRAIAEGRWEEMDDPPVDKPEYPSLDEIRSELAGHDLACWCPLDQPCHADVLLDLANR